MTWNDCMMDVLGQWLDLTSVDAKVEQMVQYTVFLRIGSRIFDALNWMVNKQRTSGKYSTNPEKLVPNTIPANALAQLEYSPKSTNVCVSRRPFTGITRQDRKMQTVQALYPSNGSRSLTPGSPDFCLLR